jgi:hypothetical protein
LPHKKIGCEFCNDPLLASPHVFKFAILSDFSVVLDACLGYKQKYAGRIESIKRKFEGKTETSNKGYDWIDIFLHYEL